MSFAAALFFGSAFMLAAYAIIITLAHSWPHIGSVAQARGVPAQRTIRCGKVRHTGNHVRLIVVNELDAMQPTFRRAQLQAA